MDFTLNGRINTYQLFHNSTLTNWKELYYPVLQGDGCIHNLFLIVQLLGSHVLINGEIVKFAILNFIILSVQKITGRIVLKRFRLKVYNSRRIEVIADNSTIPFIEQIIQTDDWGYRIRGRISDFKQTTFLLLFEHT